MLQIKRLRKQLGISQETLSEILDVSQQTISKYENQKRVPDLQMLIRLAEFFHVSLDDLVGRTSFIPCGSETLSYGTILNVSDLSLESRQKLIEYKELLKRSERLDLLEEKKRKKEKT